MKLRFEEGIDRTQPDPFMCEVEGGWAMYVTAFDGVEAYSSDSPFGTWKFEGVVCKVENAWRYWAPCIIRIGEWYYLYFSCTKEGRFEYLHVAKSKNPFGPFEDAHCMYDHFTIDAHVVQTKDGLFLWYAQNNPEDTEHPGTRVYVERLLDSCTPDGHPREVIVPTMLEEKSGENWYTIEGAFWVEHEGYQYVMYSAGSFMDDTYHIGYSYAKSSEQDLTKVDYVKYTRDGAFDPVLIKNELEEGTGHHSVICYEGQYYAVYHGRDVSENVGRMELDNEKRTARICKLFFEDGKIRAERI